MATRVIFMPRFLKDLTRLERKYPQVLDDVEVLVEQLKAGEHPGKRVPGLNYLVFKTRLPNSSAHRGKSGGFRMLYCIRQRDVLLMLTLYTKSEQQNISPEQIRRIIEEYSE